MHLGILPFQIYISSKTYVLKDQTLYIYFFFFVVFTKSKQKEKQNGFHVCVCVTEKLQQNLYLTNCNGSVTVLLHNARTRALFDFWFS